jgi:hypothetical protein
MGTRTTSDWYSGLTTSSSSSGNRREVCVLGTTHHGFKADASEVKGELERIVSEVRATHPGSAVD